LNPLPRSIISAIKTRFWELTEQLLHIGAEKLCFGVGQIARASATLNTQQTTGLFTLSLLAPRPVTRRRNLFKKTIATAKFA
jgi:hypothetical protein